MQTRNYQRAYRQWKGTPELSLKPARPELARALRNFCKLSQQIRTQYPVNLSEAFREFVSGRRFFSSPELDGHGGPNGSAYVLFVEAAFLAKELLEKGAKDQALESWRDVIPTLLGTCEIFGHLYFDRTQARSLTNSAYAYAHFRVNQRALPSQSEEKVYAHYAPMAAKDWEGQFDSISLWLQSDSVKTGLTHHHPGSGALPPRRHPPPAAAANNTAGQ